ncbi:hypothetical protein [Mucilaginibacter rubeus]|uniref:FimB/Mfa2 family fimbrial subunit n=1 Tax=Mucilaginibacter rubeus TaxID=2027860 RepID=A0A5C1I496_9SPHI|nr:hypothetical protein [Mucilaginibacter rubeus]QEM11981.1 hypothetical protein DEO27_018735 [Mucilaginibacter rubeus]
MKKYLPLLLGVYFFAFSCKKDHHPGTDPDAKEYDVKFGLNGFTQSITTMAGKKTQTNGLQTNATPTPVTADYLKVVRYLVFGPGDYSEEGPIFHSIVIDSTASNFGVISDRLPAGTYTVVVAAGKAGLQFSNSNPKQIYYTKDVSYQPFWKDTFFDKFQLTVSGDINQDVTLSRIVAQLQINIEDAIPANAKTIIVNISDESRQYLIGTEKSGQMSSMTLTIVIPDAAKGKPNFKITSLMGNTSTPFAVKITCYDANQNAVGSGVTVPNVTCQKNTKTILSGKLFNYGTTDPFTIGINNDWDPTPVVAHY